jgi:hypothetical protein
MFQDLQDFQKTQTFRGDLPIRVQVRRVAFRRNDLGLATFQLKPGRPAPPWTFNRLNHPVHPVHPVSFFYVPILENQTL